MSCIFVVTPLVMAAGGWPAFCAAAAAAAGALGYRRAARGAFQSRDLESMNEVEVAMERSRVIAEALAEDERVTLQRDGVQVEFYKDPRGRFAVHVKGANMTKSQLEEEGARVIGRVRQQYAYQKMMVELERRGYETGQEEVDEDGRIKIKMHRMS